MKHGRRLLAALAISGLFLAASTTWAFSTAGTAHQRRKHHKKPVKPTPVPIEAPAPPPPPPVPMHEAAVPPQVTYEHGDLTIEARNSTLSDVLQAVEKHTGATFDISSGDTSERVVGRIGPGPARDVLTTLLNGSHFNYVMVSPMGNPGALSRVLLTPRSSALAQGSAPQQPTISQFQQPLQLSPALQVQQLNATDDSTENGDTAEENADTQDQDAQGDTAQADQPVQPPPTPPGVKTPEQLLQELRQQQQSLQQQQGRQPGQNPPDNN